MGLSNWSVLCDSKAAHPEPIEEKALFEKFILIWLEKANSYNRRIAGAIDVDEDSIENLDVLKKLPENINLNVFRDMKVRKFIPKSGDFSEFSYEVSYFEEDFLVRFWPICMDERVHPHMAHPYSFACIKEQNNSLRLQVLIPSEERPEYYKFMQYHAFPQAFKWFQNLDPKRQLRKTNSLMDIESYSRKYRNLKENIGKPICQVWEEKTDPQKFVYEDCGIAAYLTELWSRGLQPLPKKFVDVGCGNGLLVHLLRKSGFNGYGVDVRMRKIWSNIFEEDDLREISVDPLTCYDDGVYDADVDYLIGNHSDELTPWLPIMAARLKCNFFLLPCCPFQFYGKFMGRTKSSEDPKRLASQYECFFEYTANICRLLGYSVKQDRMSIPSTKRLCLVCTIPKEGLKPDFEAIIERLTAPPHNTEQKTFVARSKKIEIKNCLNVPPNVRDTMTRKFFDVVLNSSTETKNGWRCGGIVGLRELAEHLSEDEKKLIKDQDGGLQTFLKNQHQTFHVYQGSVRLRDFREPVISRNSNKKRKENSEKPRPMCWMAVNHPDGCPMDKTLCRYAHEIS